MSIEPENNEASKEKSLTPEELIKPIPKAEGSLSNCLLPFPEEGHIENKKSDTGPAMIPKNPEKQVANPKIRTDPFVLPPPQLSIFNPNIDKEADEFEKQEKIHKQLTISKNSKDIEPQKIDESNIEASPIEEGSEVDREIERPGRALPAVFKPSFDNPDRNNLRPGPPGPFEITVEPVINRPLNPLDGQGNPQK